MRVQFRKTFAKDLQDIRDRHLLDRIKQAVESVEQAEFP